MVGVAYQAHLECEQQLQKPSRQRAVTRVTMTTISNSPICLKMWSGQNRTGRTACYGHVATSDTLSIKPICSLSHTHTHTHSHTPFFTFLVSHFHSHTFDEICVHCAVEIYHISYRMMSAIVFITSIPVHTPKHSVDSYIIHLGQCF